MSNYPASVTYKNFNKPEEEVLSCKCCDTIFLESELNGKGLCDDCQSDELNEERLCD